MIKILDQIEVSKVLEAYYALENGIVWTEYGQNSRQTGLQYKLDEDPWTSGVGKSKGHELEYDIINPFFKDTIFENIIEKYSLKRARFMWLGPHSCYSMHRDYTIRIHIPIITNPDCYFVFKLGEVIHLPVDSVYQVTTTQLHTFINCSNSYRLHLIGIPTFANIRSS